MASKSHQFIADVVATRMCSDGYSIVSFEGASSTETIKSKIPPKIFRHRPDVVGLKGKELAIGEAKTCNDFSLRTKEQLEDFADRSLWPTEINHVFYLGIPESMQEKIASFFQGSSSSINEVILLKVPDRLLPNE